MNKHMRDEGHMKSGGKACSKPKMKMSQGGSAGGSEVDSIFKSGRNITHENSSTNRDSGLGVKKSKMETLKMAAGGVGKVRKGQY